MAKKKKLYPNRTRNNIITAAAFFVFIGALVAIIAVNAATSGWIFKIDGTRVSEKDLRVLLYQEKLMYEVYYQMGSSFWYEGDETTTYGSQVMESMLRELVYQQVSVKEGAARGLSISEEQRADAKEAAGQFRELFSREALNYIGLSERQLQRVFENEAMRSVLYEDITNDVFIDEAEFEETYAQYLTDNRITLEPRNINFIITETEEAADSAMSRAKAGEDIYGLIKELCVEYSHEECEDEDDHSHEGHDHAEDFRMEPEKLSDLVNYELWFLTDAMILNLYELKEGEFSGVIEFTNAPTTELELDAETGEEIEIEIPGETRFAVIKIDSIEMPDYDEVREEQWINFVDGKKGDVFTEVFTAIIEQYEIEFNTDKMRTLDIAAMPM